MNTQPIKHFIKVSNKVNFLNKIVFILLIKVSNKVNFLNKMFFIVLKSINKIINRDPFRINNKVIVQKYNKISIYPIIKFQIK